MLANLGARVIKVEEPELGDPVRSAPPFSGGRSLLAEALLSGLESIALDLKQAGGLEVVESLLDHADVLLETFRPGTLERFGLSPPQLREKFPRLVICSLSGWGSSGPAAGRAGHDLSYQAAAGTLAATGRTPNLPAADLLGAWSAVAAINAALFARAHSGAGARIDASLFDAAVVGNVTNVAAARSVESELPAPGPLTGALPCYRIYRTADGRLFAVAALEEKFWRQFCAAAERPDLLALQYDRDPDAHRQVGELMLARTSAEWAKLFGRHDIPGEPVARPEHALEGDQATARGLAGGARGGIPFPALLDGERPAMTGDMPRLGAHTRELLAQFCPEKLKGPRRQRVAAGIGPRFSLKRSLVGWVGTLKR